MEEEKKELEFTDITSPTKDKFKTKEYKEEERNGRMIAITISPTGKEVSRFISGASREKNESMIKSLTVWLFGLPIIAALGMLLIDGAWWLGIAMPIVIATTELFYIQRIYKSKYDSKKFNWKLEKLKAISVGMCLVAGYDAIAWSLKKAIKQIGFGSVIEFLSIYGTWVVGVGLVLTALVGWLIINKTLAENKLGKDKII